MSSESLMSRTSGQRAFWAGDRVPDAARMPTIMDAARRTQIVPGTTRLRPSLLVGTRALELPPARLPGLTRPAVADIPS
jgi:hypothetical protein